ncbi:ubiquitin-like-conjugating enzyme ATG10 isoform X1 [Phlebotomus argentipes]|uniref:ubiquitin-like-conjugating enzyme ATG10 isoform X1 n=1 Tax=Phlebotomus argentipes TaxID=94469 RepID=UPI0028935006|nr:ubiquitin-like-conjugating enzyme ATG10 isoform X1 [Phlebotomus argentipes]
MTPEEFRRDAGDFLDISDRLGDAWELKSVKNRLEEEVPFLLKRGTKVSSAEKIFSIEFHVTYHVSYQVPVLGFEAFASDGSSVRHEDVWKLLKIEEKPKDFFSVLTQMDHPALFRPIWTLHPCRTAEILESVTGNRIVAFLSAVGPSVGLSLDLAYGILRKFCTLSKSINDNSALQNHLNSFCGKTEKLVTS